MERELTKGEQTDADQGGAPGLRAVSVVIVSHNEGDLLRKTVDSFLGSSSVPDEIVVVDDRSTDGSADFLADGYGDAVLLRPAEQLGISRARNHGGQRAHGDVVVFSDAHVEVTEGWLDPILAALADPEVGEVAPEVGWLDGRPGRGRGFTWADPSLKMRWLYQDHPEPFDIPFICGCFLAMRRELFEQVGGFDDGMYRWGFEDAELSLRLWLQGYRCQAVSQSFIRHHFRPDFPYQVDRSGIVYNALRLATLHFDEPAIERVIGQFCTEPAFGRAWARLLDSDTWDRREAIAGRRRREFRWFLGEVGIDALG